MGFFPCILQEFKCYRCDLMNSLKCCSNALNERKRDNIQSHNNINM